MPAVRRFSRIDTLALKVQMNKTLGLQKAEKYFNLLTRYLSLKLRKPEFDKLCVGLIGRENVHLHNELIKSLLKNATFSKTPPPKQPKTDGRLTLKAPNGTHPRNGLQSLCFPQSPRKGRTPNLRERKFRDRQIPHETVPTIQDLATRKVQEQQSQTGSKPPAEVSYVEVSEELEKGASRIPVTAPLGVSIHSKATRKPLYNPLGSAYSTETCCDTRWLPATNALEKRIQQKLKTKGLDISADCVNLLNNGLDSFLKRVVKPILVFSGSRSSQESGTSSLTSMLDFRAAAEIHPKILGEDWPIQLERLTNDGVTYVNGEESWKQQRF